MANELQRSAREFLFRHSTWNDTKYDNIHDNEHRLGRGMGSGMIRAFERNEAAMGPGTLPSPRMELGSYY